MTYHVVVDTRLCKGCGICISICPKQALVLSKNLSEHGYQYPVADDSKCIGCRLCEVFCPDFAIHIERKQA